MRRRIGNLFLGLVSCLAVLLAAELLLRLFGYQAALSQFYLTDPLLGWRLRPNAEGWQTEEGKQFVRINSAGYRDLEREIKKPKDVYRIAVLGDSFTQAMEVALAEAFPAVVEQELKHCEGLAGKTPEVLNFGVKGYGTGQELLSLKRDVWQYQPDFVVLAVFSENDVFDNHPELNHTDAELAPYFRLDKDGKLQLESVSDRSPWLSAVRSNTVWLKTHSHIGQLIDKFMRLTSATQGKRNQTRLIKKFGKNYGAVMIYRTPTLPELLEAWEVTEALLIEFSREVREKGAGFLLTTLSNPIQVEPNAERRNAFQRQIKSPDLFYPDRRIERLAIEQHIPHAILAPELQKLAESDNAYYHGFENMQLGNGHYNPLGHQRVGALLAEAICEEISRRPAAGIE